MTRSVSLSSSTRRNNKYSPNDIRSIARLLLSRFSLLFRFRLLLRQQILQLLVLSILYSEAALCLALAAKTFFLQLLFRILCLVPQPRRIPAAWRLQDLLRVLEIFIFESGIIVWVVAVRTHKISSMSRIHFLFTTRLGSRHLGISLRTTEGIASLVQPLQVAVVKANSFSSW